MPTGHRKTWKSFVKLIHQVKEVALTALPGHSDAQRYYKVTRYYVLLHFKIFQLVSKCHTNVRFSFTLSSGALVKYECNKHRINTRYDANIFQYTLMNI